MSLARYSLIVLGIVTGSLGVLLPVLDGAARLAATLGAALAAANTLAAYSLVSWSEKRSTNTFLRAVLGGMLARMALLLGAVVLAVLYLGLPRIPLAISLLSYFVLFLVFELRILHKRTSRPAVAR